MKRKQQPDNIKHYFNIEKPTGRLDTLKAVLLLSYNINKWKNFENIKFKQVKDITLLKRLKTNLLYLEYIDPNSQLYNGIFTVVKKTLEEEFIPKKYEYWYHYLLDYFCELDLKAVVGKKSQRVEFFPDYAKASSDKQDKEKNVNSSKDIMIIEEAKFIATSSKEILVNPKYTGKQFLRDKQRFEDFKENLNL